MDYPLIIFIKKLKKNDLEIQGKLSVSDDYHDVFFFVSKSFAWQVRGHKLKKDRKKG